MRYPRDDIALAGTVGLLMGGMKNAPGHPGAENPTWRALGEVLRT
jgi:hypothetical protein